MSLELQQYVLSRGLTVPEFNVLVGRVQEQNPGADVYNIYTTLISDEFLEKLDAGFTAVETRDDASGLVTRTVTVNALPLPSVVVAAVPDA